ncbi:MAG: primosomal protein N' [Bacteroidales bacterium]|nr:primosomal protein N' [Bacteroidales bacterium]MBD5222626.1 primosomal protein N' [Bacteroidales bacterium]
MIAEIILPLPIYGTFSYLIPPEMETEIQIGSRVMVQFGRKKYYTGIVERIHRETPPYEVKPLMAILDGSPAVRYPQLRFWNWISEYYLCTVGDVYKAAIPSGLKPESETFVTLNEDYGTPEGEKLTEREAMVMMLLEEKKKLRLSDIDRELKLKNTPAVINRLLVKRLVNIDEKIVEKYRAKKETVIELTIERGDQDALHEFFEKTRRSVQQEKALICYLDMSHWVQPGAEVKEVTRKELLEASRISPGILRSMIDKGIFRQKVKQINRYNPTGVKTCDISPLSPVQSEALKAIESKFRDSQTVLLHGVTGSGKTEIYMHLISEMLKAGRQILYLVPEISLTTQLTDRLRRVLGDRLLVYHSKFSDSERVDIWKKMLNTNEPLVILGARSSVFLPFSSLGLVIVDEEHESSFKQFDPAPRYNARDASIMLAGMHGAKVLLGSATPSIETYYKALTGKYGLVSLNERYSGTELPEVEIVDMKEQRKKKLNSGVLSAPLKSALRKTLGEGHQSILFQNRRGFAPVVVCRECGWTPKCENCDVSLVYHKSSNLLKCHYCGFTRTLPTLCPACGQNSVETFGYGTERIAEEVHHQFPDARVSRMDLDTTRNKESHQELIEEFARHETDILVGTQMVSKGLDFEDVRMAGVINADTLLNFPDFRSNERAFNMLEQVAGRAGRRNHKGTVLIQTTDPENPVLDFVTKHDYRGFYDLEIKEREKYSYPPFTKVINIYLRNKDASAVDRAAVVYATRLRSIFGNRVLGPEKPFVSRIALWYIQSIMLKVEAGASMKKVKDILRQLYESCAQLPDIKTSNIYYDVDPS